MNKNIAKIVASIVLPLVGLINGCGYEDLQTDQGCFRKDVITGALWHSPNCNGTYNRIGNAQDYAVGLDGKIYPKQRNYQSNEEQIKTWMAIQGLQNLGNN